MTRGMVEYPADLCQVVFQCIRVSVGFPELVFRLFQVASQNLPVSDLIQGGCSESIQPPVLCLQVEQLFFQQG